MRLLERDDELRELDLLLDQALGGGRGRVVLLEGQPGIGKTQLLDALRGRARERGATVLAARASELDRDFPFGVVRQLFEPLVAAGRSAPARQAAGRRRRAGRPAAGRRRTRARRRKGDGRPRAPPLSRAVLADREPRRA